jgi:hypothetical protein
LSHTLAGFEPWIICSGDDAIITITPPAGLPDGIFGNQNSQFGYILEGHEMEMLVHFMAIWNKPITAIWYTYSMAIC